MTASTTSWSSPFRTGKTTRPSQCFFSKKDRPGPAGRVISRSEKIFRSWKNLKKEKCFVHSLFIVFQSKKG